MLAAHRNQRSEGRVGALKGTLQRVSDAGRGGQGGALEVRGEDTQPGDGEERGTCRLWMACTSLPALAHSPRPARSLWRRSSRSHTPPLSPPRRAPGWGGSTAAFVVLLEFGAATTWLRLFAGGRCGYTPNSFVTLHLPNHQSFPTPTIPSNHANPIVLTNNQYISNLLRAATTTPRCSLLRSPRIHR